MTLVRYGCQALKMTITKANIIYLQNGTKQAKGTIN